MKCNNCGNENKNTNIRCEFCGTELNFANQNDNFLNKDYSLNNVQQMKLNNKKVKLIFNIVLICMFVPWFIAGIAFIAVSSYSNISDNNKSKNYLETEGKISGYNNCTYDDEEGELCNAIYEYVVNGITYKGSPNLSSNKSGFKETITVKYNPNNPNEYVMDSGWNNLLIFGILLVVFVSTLFIVGEILLKILFKKIDNEMEKNNQIVNG